jgi:outer membrane protein OmpA-like peptidoglycan-associated protein
MQKLFRTLGLLACALPFLGGALSGCASKPAGAPQVATDINTLPPDGSLHGNPQVVDQSQQTRWAYTGMPTPALSSKPNYLLKSYSCGKGSASMNAEAQGAMRELVTLLKEKPNVRVAVIGLCDNQAEGVNAQNLGMNRADAARKFLVDQGLSKDRIEVSSFGSAMATAGPDETIGQAQDRRVEVWLLTE